MITIEQFNKEVCNFRSAFGTKQFWSKENEDKRELAVKAIGVCYFRTETKNEEETKQIATTYQAVMDEYTRRSIIYLHL